MIEKPINRTRRESDVMLDRYASSIRSDPFSAAGMATEAVGEPAGAMVAAALSDECAHGRIVEDDDADISDNAMAVATGGRPGRPKDEVSVGVHDSRAERMPLLDACTVVLLLGCVVRTGSRHSSKVVRYGKAGA
jgi:hypothetical protein